MTDSSNSALKEGIVVGANEAVRLVEDTVLAIDSGTATNQAIEDTAIKIGCWLADVSRSDLPNPSIGGRLTGALGALVELALPTIRAMQEDKRARAASTAPKGEVH